MFSSADIRRGLLRGILLSNLCDREAKRFEECLKLHSDLVKKRDEAKAAAKKASAKAKKAKKVERTRKKDKEAKDAATKAIQMAKAAQKALDAAEDILADTIYRSDEFAEFRDLLEKRSEEIDDEFDLIVSRDRWSNHLRKFLLGRKCCSDLTLKETIALAEAAGFESFDLFIDACLPSPENSDYREIRELREHVQGKRWRIRFPSKKDLWGTEGNPGYYRTRIDVLEIAPQIPTPWDPHLGHEYVLCVKGNVEIQLRHQAPSPNGEDEETFKTLKNQGVIKTIELKEDEAATFPSGLYHRVVNIGGENAIIHSAKPALAPTPPDDTQI